MKSTTENVKRMTKADIKKMKSKTNWARLASEDKKENASRSKVKSR